MVPLLVIDGAPLPSKVRLEFEFIYFCNLTKTNTHTIQANDRPEEEGGPQAGVRERLPVRAEGRRQRREKVLRAVSQCHAGDEESAGGGAEGSWSELHG